MTGQADQLAPVGRNPRRVAVLGSTGSVGTSTLDVVAALPERLAIAGLSAHSKWELLAEQCRRFRPRVAVLTDAEAFQRADRSVFPRETELLCGDDAVCALASAPDVDVVLAAVVGAAGLAGTWAALEAGKTVALANKETLVVGGQQVMGLAARRGATVLPVDSEHSAIFQALTGYTANDVAKVVLTASGGPFRGRTAADLESVSVEQALCHPTWKMGPKITVDSATMMNKALEVIEARWLFGLDAGRIDVIVHPESIVHSFVEFVDGSVLAQLSPPDMRLPIQFALTHPARVPGPARKLDWKTLTGLTFCQPDRATFRGLDLGFEAAARGGTCGAVLNGANEAAVAAFLAREIGFLDIARCCRAVIDAHDYDPAPPLAGLLAADRWARQEVARWTRTRPRTARP
ncbi:1-deoxy-D-xylulose-5-phosphate reductoisomerase [Fimbriiglobus ruber]|uniref:1-deoxy-D-xylulose-5-phosphate reductoisomerase n=1 Tax=Fimbriiglobus ruber TaxID=1908690 RepID=UPI001EE6D82D|nr:1-deoxy-D-xylulose-5-phosphate reductoisomerase [Fimbriiglobus ruber]